MHDANRDMHEIIVKMHVASAGITSNAEMMLSKWKIDATNTMVLTRVYEESTTHKNANEVSVKHRLM